MAKYYSPDEKKLKNDLEPIIKRMDYTAARQLREFFEDLDSVIYKMKELDSELERFHNNFRQEERFQPKYKPAITAVICEGLSEEDTKVLSGFLTKTMTDLEEVGSAIYSIRRFQEAYEDLAEEAQERWYSPQIDIYVGKEELHTSGEEARELINDYGRDIKAVHVEEDGRIDVTLLDGSVISHPKNDPLAEIIREFVGEDTIAKLAKRA